MTRTCGEPNCEKPRMIEVRAYWEDGRWAWSINWCYDHRSIATKLLDFK